MTTRWCLLAESLTHNAHMASRVDNDVCGCSPQFSWQYRCIFIIPSRTLIRLPCLPLNSPFVVAGERLRDSDITEGEPQSATESSTPTLSAVIPSFGHSRMRFMPLIPAFKANQFRALAGEMILTSARQTPLVPIRTRAWSSS